MSGLSAEMEGVVVNKPPFGEESYKTFLWLGVG